MAKDENDDRRYQESFSRNLGWITAAEQQALRGKRIAIAGLGGVGGAHLLTLARLGIGGFHIADSDHFERVNFNRQVGAFQDTLGRPKVEVMAEMARGINPEADIRSFREGVTLDNLDSFLEGVDLFVDGFDAFVLDIRARTFARCAELKIPAITAAPLGLGSAYLIFLPGGMTFEDYFRLDGLPAERQYVHWFLGLAPKGLHRRYLVEPGRLDVRGHRAPSTGAACSLCAGIVGVEALKLLLCRGKVYAAPYYQQFDVYRERFVRGKLRGGNRHPLQRLRIAAGTKFLEKLTRDAHTVEGTPPQTRLERTPETTGRYGKSLKPTEKLCEAVKAGDVEGVLLALNAGANVNAADAWQQTPLHHAGVHDRTAIARMLIDRGAHVDARDRWQQTPLHYAAENGSTATARMLMEKGAAIDAKGAQQVTPVQLAAAYGHLAIVALLKGKA